MILEELNLLCISCQQDLEKEVKGVYVSDLLSDVVGHAKEFDIWITLHTHPNIIAVGKLKNISAIIITNGSEPEDETKQLSEHEHIPILVTKLSTFQIAGKIFKHFSSLAE